MTGGSGNGISESLNLLDLWGRLMLEVEMEVQVEMEVEMELISQSSHLIRPIW